MAMEKEIKPMRMDLENVAQFHLNVMKIQRRVKQSNNRRTLPRHFRGKCCSRERSTKNSCKGRNKGR